MNGERARAIDWRPRPAGIVGRGEQNSLSCWHHVHKQEKKRRMARPNYSFEKRKREMAKKKKKEAKLQRKTGVAPRRPQEPQPRQPGESKSD